MSVLVEDEQLCETEPLDRGAAEPSQAAEHALTLIRNAVIREMEAELRGLLMAARMHSLHLAIIDGKPVVTCVV